MVLQWARAKEEIDLGKTMKGAQLERAFASCNIIEHSNRRWLECTKQKDQASSQHSQARGRNDNEQHTWHTMAQLCLVSVSWTTQHQTVQNKYWTGKDANLAGGRDGDGLRRCKFDITLVTTCNEMYYKCRVHMFIRSSDCMLAVQVANALWSWPRLPPMSQWSSVASVLHVAREIVQNPWQSQAWEYLGLAFRSEQGEQNAVLVGEATFAVRSLEEIDMEFSRWEGRFSMSLGLHNNTSMSTLN